MNNQPWLRIGLQEVLPTLDKSKVTGQINAMTAAGAPKKFYHGTYGQFALSIITNRKLNHGTKLTGTSAGLWHGPPRTAVSYAWPTQWPKCSQYTMAMFEVSVIAHKTHSENVYVSKQVGSYEVTALLLHRYRGNSSAEALAHLFHRMRNGEDDLGVLWLEDPVRLHFSLDQPVEDPSSSSDEEGSWKSAASEPIVEDVTDSDIERAPQELEKIELFKQKVAAHARSNGLAMPQLKQHLRPTPFQFSDGDDRFNKKGTDRVYACDSCGMLVGFSRYHTNGFYRADATFMGSYSDSSWKDLPGEFRQEAWQLGLIDASWFCHVVCGNKPTGIGKDPKRLVRAQNYKAPPSKPTGRGKGIAVHPRLVRAPNDQSQSSKAKQPIKPTGRGKGKDHTRLDRAPNDESQSSIAKRPKPAYWT